MAADAIASPTHVLVSALRKLQCNSTISRQCTDRLAEGYGYTGPHLTAQHVAAEGRT